MPIYEYACGSCGYHLDVFQRMSDDPLIQCEQCGKPSLVKLVSAAGFRLKGGGWYETDFKKDGDKKKNLVTTDLAPSTSVPEKTSSTTTVEK